MKAVLLVDDEQSVLLSLSLALRELGYNVFTAFNGEEALLQVQQNRPDVVLLDIMMPGMNGLETLKTLKTHPDFRDLPVIIMSGAHPLVDQEEYEWADFLSKPFTRQELVKILQKHSCPPDVGSDRGQ